MKRRSPGTVGHITERRWPFPEHTYEIVNAKPLGYTVWNIGPPVAGESISRYADCPSTSQLPGGQSIDVDSLKAIRCDGAQTILDAVGYGPGTLEEMERFVEKHKMAQPGTSRYERLSE